MSDYMKPEDWLAVIRKEYLRDYVKSGGAAVKFIVPLNETGPATIINGLAGLAAQEGYFFAPVDAATTKIHLIEQLFSRVARQVDWDELSLAFLKNILAEHYKLPDDKNNFDLKHIAAVNCYEERELRPLLNNRLRERLFQDYAMTQEFRIAMMWLCRYRLDPAEVGEDLHQGIIEWLRGDLNRVTALKSALIFQKIGRHNARNMLFSFAHWLKLTGKNGLMLVLDIERYTQDRPKEREAGALYYSHPAVLDCYEVLRQLVDDTDEAEYCFTCVVAPLRFVTEGDRRGVDAYTALKLRIWDEVRDRTRVDPLSSLIRVCACENLTE